VPLDKLILIDLSRCYYQHGAVHIWYMDINLDPQLRLNWIK
jgi:hypothetical protein